MHSVVIYAITVSVVVVVVGDAHEVVEHPGGGVVGLDGGLHQQGAAQHVCHVAIKSLDVFGGVGQAHVVLVGVGVDQAGVELDELGVHRVVHAGGISFVVGAGTFECSLLVEIVQGDVIGIVGAAAGEVDIVILPDACLEDFLEPVGVGIVLEMIFSGGAVELVA